MSEQQQAHPTTTESELIAVRRDKLAKIRELGIDPYGARFDVTTTPAGLKADFQEDKQVAVAGRLLAIRDMGKSQFSSLGTYGEKSRGSCIKMRWMKPPGSFGSSWTAGLGRHQGNHVPDPYRRTYRKGIRTDHSFQKPPPPAGQVARAGGQGGDLPQAPPGPHFQ